MNDTLKQLHADRLARRGIEIIEPVKAEEMMAMGAEDRDAPAPPAPVVVEEEEVEGCPVCLMPMETRHTLHCGHEICGDCPAMMMTQNLGNGCVGLHADAGIKVIKCPICRKEDMPTREELIAEIVRIRRGGYFQRMAHAHAQPAPIHHPRVMHQDHARMGQPAPAHNLPAVIPVLQPVIQHAQPAPAIHPPLLANGNWLRNRNYQPRGNRGDDINYFLIYIPLHFNGDNIGRWNIFRGHPHDEVREVNQFLRAGISQNQGVVCGQGNNRVFYHQQFFVPNSTEGGVPARRLCNNNGTCATQQRSRTARRCTRGCGQFICQGCGVCNNERCQECN
jgi:hypothetical protein